MRGFFLILFWDKNLPKTIPESLRNLNPKVGDETLGIEIYLEHFPMSDREPEGGDDRWLPTVGEQGWFVVTQDWALHTKQNQLLAIKQHMVGCFYLWGATEPKWEILRCFARGYDRILAAATATSRPFIFRVTRTGLLWSIPLP